MSTPPLASEQADSAIRDAYEKQYPEHRGVATQAARNHYGAFKTGWMCALACRARGDTK